MNWPRGITSFVFLLYTVSFYGETLGKRGFVMVLINSCVTSTVG
jgi:hypothetical protein